MGSTRSTFAAVVALAGISLSAGVAYAQGEDPIGALLENPRPATPAPSPSSSAGAPIGQSPAPRPVTPAPPRSRVSPPITPPPTPLRPRSNRDLPTIASKPVFLDAPNTLGAPLTAEERSYEARLRASFESAQGLQGPLDGGWVLSGRGSGEIYALRFVDRGASQLEAAWRDLRRPGAIAGSGFVDSVERSGGGVTLRFTPRRGAPPTVITLSAGANGQWQGDLVEDGAPRGVVMRRR